MSSILKLFGERKPKRSKAVASAAPTRPQSSSSIDGIRQHDPSVDFPEKFSDDAAGQALINLWEEYLVHKSSVLPASAEQLSALHSVISSILRSSDSPEEEHWHTVTNHSHGMPTVAEGHPIHVVLEIIHVLFNELRDPEATRGFHNHDSDDEYDLPAGVTVAMLFPTGSAPRAEPVALSELQRRRVVVLDMLHCVSIFSRSASSCSIIHHTLEKPFARLVTSVFKQLLSQLTSLVADRNIDEAANEDVVFALRALVHVTHVVSHGFVSAPPEFVDLLPPQPWSQAAVVRILDPSYKWKVIVSNSNPSMASASAKNKKLKTDFVHDLAIAGAMKVFMEAVQILTEIRAAALPNTLWLSVESKTLLLLLEAEVLHGMVGLAAAFPDFVPLELSLFRPVQRTFDMNTNQLIPHDPLLIRKQLLCLRLNSWLMNRLRTAKPDAPHHTLRLLNTSALTTFLSWMSVKFDSERQPGDWIETMAASEKFGVDLCVTLKTGGVTTAHDMWPWNDPPSGAHEFKQDYADFHLLSKPVATAIQALLKAQPAWGVWDSCISEILGSYMLSHRQNNASTSKVSKDSLHYVYEVFDSLFRSQTFVQVDYHSSDNLLAPFTQIKFVDFISQLFKAADASSIFSIIGEFETFRFLLGDRFLLAQSGVTRHLSDLFQTAVVRRTDDGGVRVHLHTVTNKRFECIYLWWYLQNSVVDYFHGLVIYSLYFQSEHAEVQAYLGYEDILLVLAQYMLSLSKSTFFPGHILFQLSCLIFNLSDIALSMDLYSSAPNLLKLIRLLLEVIDHNFRGRITQSAERADFELVGCYAVVQLLLHLIQPSAGSHFSPKDVFLVDDTCLTLDLVQEISTSLRPRASSFVTPERRHSRLGLESPRTGEAAEKGLKVRSSLTTVVSMLLNDHFQLAGLAVIQSVVVSCATAMAAAEALPDSERKHTKQALRALAVEALAALLHIVAVSYKHPHRPFNATAASNCLNALTVLLRDGRWTGLRMHIQEFVRRENLIYELLRAMAKCLNGHEMIRARAGSDDSAEPPPNPAKSILCAGLSALGSIVCGNEACKNALRVLLNSSREKIGATRARHATSLTERKDRAAPAQTKSASGLVSLILCADRTPCVEVVVIMMDLLLDTPGAGRDFTQRRSEGSLSSMFTSQDDKPTLKNTAVLQDFFQLLPHCDEAVQRFGLESFRNLISGRGALVNLTVCASSRPKVFDTVLDLFPHLPDGVQSCNAELLDLLGRYVVSVSSLKHLFRVLQKPDGSSPAYAWKVIQALQGMFSEDHGPRHTFVLDGIASGLRLPAIYRWPKVRGLTLTCWIRVQAPNINYDWMSYCPQVFSLRDEKGVGLQLFLRQDRANGPLRIVLQHSHDSTDTFAASPSTSAMEMVEGKWYFLAVALSAGTFYSKGEVRIHLNDNTFREDVGPWKVPDGISEPIIGDCPNALRNEAAYRTMRGQLGAIYFFSEALSDQQLQGIHGLGPDYIYNFEPYSAGYKELGQRKRVDKRSILEDGSVTGKIMLAFNPVVLRGKYFLDNTPEKNEVLWRLPAGVEVVDDLRSDLARHIRMHAMRLPGTFRSTVQDVRLALNSLGGIKAIVPLFAQLVQTRPADIDAALADEAVNANFFPAVLGLFTTLINDNEDNKRLFLRSGGFAVIRDFLEKAPGACFNLITLNQFVAILENLKSDAVAKESCFDSVLCNFRLWARASVEVQGCWLDWLINALGALQLSSPAAYSAQRFVDVFYAHYDYLPAGLPLQLVRLSRDTEVSVYTPDALARPEAMQAEDAALVRSNITDEQLQHLRAKVYHLIKISIARGHAPAHEDAVALIRYTMATADLRGKVETLRFMDALLTNLEDVEKAQDFLLGVTLTDSLLCLEHLLAQDCARLFDAALALLSTIAFRMAIHKLDFSALAGGKVKPQQSSPVKSPSAEEAGQSPCISSEQGDAAAVVLGAPQASFVEIGNLLVLLPRLCTTAMDSMFRWGFVDRVPRMASAWAHMLMNAHLDGRSERGDRSALTLPPLGAKTLVHFPAMFFVVIKLLCYDCDQVTAVREAMLEYLLQVLGSGKIVQQVISAPQWERAMAELLDSVLSRCATQRTAATARQLRTVLQLLLALAAALMAADLASDGQSYRTLTWDAVPRQSLPSDAISVTTMRGLFAALRHQAVQTAEAHAVRQMLMFLVLWGQHQSSLQIGSKPDVWKAGCVGLALMDHLHDVLAQPPVEGADCADCADGRSASEFVWSEVVHQLLTTQWPQVAEVFGSDLSASFHAAPPTYVSAFLNWCMFKFFFSSIECGRWQASAAAVGDSIVTELQVPTASVAALASVLTSAALNAAEERKLFRSGSLPLVGMRVLCALHESLLAARPSAAWEGPFSQFYLQLLRGMEAANHELFSFERLHFLCLAPRLRMTIADDSVLVKVVVDASLVEVTDLCSLTAQDLVQVDSPRQGEDKRLDIVSAILGHNVAPSSFKARFRATASRRGDPEPSAPHSASAFVDRLVARGARFPADSQVVKEEVWVAVERFVLACGRIVVESVVARQTQDVHSRSGWSLKAGSRSSASTSQLAIAAPPRATAGIEAAALQCESERLARCHLQLVDAHRRSEIKRTRLFAQLANERGPWGYGADHRRETFWTLDHSETNVHLRTRLKRNLLGTKHAVATLKSSGKLTSAASEDALDSTNGPLGWIETDLKKYQSAATMGAKQNKLLGGEDRQGDKDDEDGSEGEEEAADETHFGDSFLGDSEALTVPAEIISPATNSSGGRTVGRLEVTRHKLSFIRAQEFAEYDFENKTGNPEFLWACQCFPSTVWAGAELTGVYRRHYQFRYVAVEVFMTNRTSVFFNLHEPSVAQRVYSFLAKRVRAPNMSMIFTGRPKNAIKRVFLAPGMTVTQAWVARKISNFEYLMHLNFIAGRTFNDLAQYPVFPWVLADYSSAKLDLKDPATFRRLDRPIGAQLDSQRAVLAEKYESSLAMCDEGFYPYHCGSHYSTSAMVLWYLIRMEPFTSLHVWLQDGKFDRPDRLFHGIPAAFQGCTTNTQDVKELIPEFFCNPEFLTNQNHVSFGRRQDGERLDDVLLPPWAKDPADFVRQHRDALESEYVSSQLHHWIDLVFGAKQRPPLLGGSDKTVQACNVFFHLSYCDAVNLEDMRAHDPAIYSRTVRQIDNYGQTPLQLFRKEHPRRKSLLETQDLLWPIASTVLGADSVGSFVDDPAGPDAALEKPKRVLCYGECKVSNAPVLFLADAPQQERLITIDARRVLGAHVFQQRNPSHVPPFALKLDKAALGQSTGQVQRSGALASMLPLGGSSREKVVGIPFASPVVLNASWMDSMAGQGSSFAELLGTRENKIRYLEDEIKARGRLEERRAAVDPQRSVVASDRRPTTSRSHSRRAPTVASGGSLSVATQQESASKSLSFSPSLKDLMSAAAAADAAGAVVVGGAAARARGISTDDAPPPPPAASPASTPPTPAACARQLPKAERADYHLNAHMFCFLPALRLVFSAGHWDNAFKVTHAETGKLVQSVSHHREVVTCVACVSDLGKHWVAAGSKDCTVTVWEVAADREGEPVHAPPVHTLYGHDDAVNCLVLHAELDLVVSGSDDGTIMLHTLRDGAYVRSIVVGALTDAPYASRPPSPPPSSPPATPAAALSPVPTAATSTPVPGAAHAHSHSQHFLMRHADKALCRVHLLAVARDGTVVAYSNDGHVLAAYTQNGRYLKLVQVRERVHAMCLSDDGRTVLTGGERGLVVVRWAHSLAIASSGARRGLESVVDGSNEPEFDAFPAPIRSLTLTAGERQLIVGLDNGDVRVLAQDSEYLRRKLHRQLIEIGMLSV